MDGSDRHHAPSNARPVASPASEWWRIEDAVAHAEVQVDRMQPSLVAQPLMWVLESCRHVMDGWRRSPPTDDEVRALGEHVEQTLKLVKTESPRVGLRRPA